MRVLAAFTATAVLGCGLAVAADPPAAPSRDPRQAPLAQGVQQAGRRQAAHRSVPGAVRQGLPRRQPPARPRSPRRDGRSGRQLDHHPAGRARCSAARGGRDAAAQWRPPGSGRARCPPLARPCRCARTAARRARGRRTAMPGPSSLTVSRTPSARRRTATSMRAAGGHVLEAVLDQVGDQLRQQLAVALHHRRRPGGRRASVPCRRAAGSNSSTSSAASSPTSTAAGAASGAPDSASAICSSVASVRCRWSTSRSAESTDSCTAGSSGGERSSSASMRVRRRCSGARRSWAALSKVARSVRGLLLEPVEHAVDRDGERVELVVGARHRQAPPGLARHDRARRCWPPRRRAAPDGN